MTRAVTWILLRGLTRESGHWGSFPGVLAAELQRQQPGASLELLDLPGNGTLHRQTSPSRVADMVDVCRDEMLRRGVPPPYHLLAMSLGAMVVSDWMRRYPEEVAGSVLINTSLRPFSPFFRRLRPSNYWPLLMLSLFRISLRQREAKVLSMTTRLQDKPEAVLENWVELQRNHPVGRRNAVRQLLAAMKYRASYARPRAPTLLLCSKGDELVDWRCSQAISRAWGVPLRLHANAGHDLPLDDAGWVARSVVDWLQAQQLLAPVNRSTPLSA